MKRIFEFFTLSLFFFLLTVQNIHAQDSVYLNMTADWNQLYSYGLGGVSKGINMIDDEKGNIYIASILRQENDAINAAVVKLNPKGEVIWENFVHPHFSQQPRGKISDATAITMDKKGNIIVLGSVFHGCKFLSQDPATEITFSFENKFRSFVAKYDQEGVLLMANTFHVGDGEFTINTANINKKGEVFFCGTLSQRPNSSTFDPAIVLGKLNPSGEIEWVKTMNGSGRDVCVGAVMDNKGNLYLGGSFEGKIKMGDDSLVSPTQSETSFIAQFDKNGKHIWTLLPKGSMYTLSNLTIDRNNRIYFSGVYHDTLQFPEYNDYIVSPKKKNLFIGCISDKGRVQWLRNITDTWKANHYDGVTRMKVGEDNFIYLGGGALEISMKLNDTSSVGFTQKYGKESKHSEGFMIKCDTEGNPHWLRLISGESTQVVSDFLINKDSDICIGGLSVGEIRYKNERAAKRGSNSFIAYVKGNTLYDSGPDKVMQDRLAEEYSRASFDMNNCTCEEYGEGEKRSVNYIPLNEFADDSTFRAITGFVGADTSDILNGAFGFNLRTSYSPHAWEGHYHFIVRAFHLVRFSPAKDEVIINLNPCDLKEGMYLIPFHFYYRHYIRDHVRTFDRDEFKKLGTEYYELAFKIFSINSESILKNLVYGEYEWNYSKLEPFVDHLKKNFDIEFDPSNNDIGYVEQIKSSAKEIDINEEIYEVYLRPLEDSSGGVTREFKNMFSTLMYNGSEEISIERMDAMITPLYKASATVTRFTIEFDSGIINSEAPWVGYKCDEMHWSTDKGISLNFKEIKQSCITPFQVSNTGILMQIDKSYPDLSAQANSLYATYYWPNIKTSYRKLANVDKEFIGIFAPQADIQIPFNDTIITAEGVDLLIENKKISGWFRIPISTMFTKEEISRYLQEKNFNIKEVIREDTHWVLQFDYQVD
ncbi:MAG: hypothetical protein R6U19_04600 [Bacteroidales bacterium]